MRWLVLGAGALGGYFGGRLMESGEDVTFLLRQRRMERVQARGLTIKSPNGDARFPAPRTLLSADVDGLYDVVIVACKAYDLDSAMDAIAPAVGPDTAILPLLNGLDHLDALSRRFGAERVLGGLCLVSAAVDDNGTVHHFNDTDSLVYGEVDGSYSERVRAIEAAFAPVNCRSEASTIIVQRMWEKWLFIAAGAGITCLMRAAIGDVVHAGARDIGFDILDECIAIAKANGHPPRPAALDQMHAFFSDADSTLTASTLKDIERGARTEGGHIVGALIARAGADTPEPRLLKLVEAHLKAYEIRRAREAADRAAD